MAASAASSLPLFFSVTFSGQIESAHFSHHSDLYCKFSFLYGPDWVVVAGLEEGLTQMASPGPGPDSASKSCVWNFPIEITFKSTNAFGWPQLILSVYGLDSFGRDVVRGYAALRMPTKGGSTTRHAPLFTPLATSPFNYYLSWLAGRLPEFVDPAFVGKGEGRGGG
ncbi:B9 domain-containing protein 1 [Gonapodya sp. JEL0774]|nr:B9 domain-containing protein 1 [Gonapodya sp. JEL0774]